MALAIGIASIASAFLLTTRSVAATPDDAANIAFFENKVRPLLVERCYKCHADDKAKGDLLLDSRVGWQKGGENGPALVPGDVEKSLIIKAIRYADDDLRMPPKTKLSTAEIDVLTEWVRRGAPDPREKAAAKPPAAVAFDPAAARRDLWSLHPLKRVEPPKNQDESWATTSIDRFVKAKLEEKGLAPNPPADKRVLVRRAYFDVLGLPPTPAEIDAFVADAAPDAYDKLIDRLLASPQFGERWARKWLDLARFGESHGFEHDYDRPTAYTYRDFVIRALNDDLPYDAFVKWQLAGDEIAPENPLAMMATGFLAAGVHSTQITKNEVEKHRYDELDDIVATVGTSMLGLTVGCARCHDHKFDPIPARDYYRMVSVFTTAVRSEVDLNLDDAAYRKAKEAFDAAHAPLTAALTTFENERLPKRLGVWLMEGGLAKVMVQSPWLVLEPSSAKSQSGAALTPQPDGSLLAGGQTPDAEVFTLTADTDLREITSVRLEALSHPSLVKGGPGRAENGNFALTNFAVTASPKDAKAAGGATPVTVKLKNPRATFEQKGLPVAAAIDSDQTSGWAVDPQFGKDHAAAFDFETPVGFEGGTLFTFRLSFNNNKNHAIARPRLSVSAGTVGPPKLDAPALPAAVSALYSHTAPATAGNAPPLSPEQRSVAMKWYRTQDSEWSRLNAAVQQHLAKAPKPATVKALVCSEGLPPMRLHSQGADFLTETHYLKRGNPDMKDGLAPPGYLQILMTSADAEKQWSQSPPAGARTSYRRRAMADWITDTKQGAGHLLARVIVNRLWQGHMGRGIVATPSDFGTRGEPPSHPELLDYLATELVNNGWHLKPIHKLIMTSSVYHQTADVDPAKAKLDPDNRLAWHRPRRRLEAEAVRDAMLAVGGALDPTMYGPGSLEQSMRRRSIYFTVKRSKLVPMLQVFDWPDALQSTGERGTTTIAPQALLLMNNAEVRAYAKGLAKRAAPDAGTPMNVAVSSAYRTALGREPTAGESADGAAFIAEQIAAYEGEKKPDGRERALADFCQALMCLNEFVYVD